MTALPRVTIVGGGIAGASLAWELARQHGVAVTLLEREARCGMHTTGRSAALYMPSYGPPAVRALTAASRGFYTDPPAGFASQPLLAPRGVLHVGLSCGEPAMAPAEVVARLDALRAQLRAVGLPARDLDAADCLRLCPALRADAVLGGLFEADALDMDVDAILQGYLRGAREAGARIVTGAEVRALLRRAGAWRVDTAAGEFTADIVVDAAGAWADVLGQLAGAAPIGLCPKRRSAFVFAPPEGTDCRAWPALIDAGERFYIKPDAGALLGSPANADPAEPHDVQPEELDIATGIWAIEQATHLSIRRPRATWAGLRSFVPDGELVIGHDPDLPGWFWLAGQGGYGIQSAPGAARAAAALLLEREFDPELRDLGLRADALAPGRARGQAGSATA